MSAERPLAPERAPAEPPKPKRVFTPQHLEALRRAHAARRGKPIKVTITPARQAAARRNLLKARQAQQDNPVFHVMTPARWWALGTATEKAHASPRSRGHGFRHGLHCPSLRDSLRAAGEDPKAFDAHLARFLRCFGSDAAPPDNAPAGEDTRLVRAAAEVAWRRLRAFRGWGRWEQAKLARLLERAVRKSSFHPRHARMMALDVLDVLLGYFVLFQHVARLNRRLEDLFREIATIRFGFDPEFRIVRKTRRQRPQLLGRSLDVMNNPLKAPVVIEGRMATESVRAAVEVVWRQMGLTGTPVLSVPLPVAPDAPRPEWHRLFRAALVPPPLRGTAEVENHLDSAVTILEKLLRLFPERAALEATTVRGVLGVLEPSPPLAELEFSAAARAILQGFAEGEEALFEAAGDLNDRFQQALGALVRSVHGEAA